MDVRSLFLLVCSVVGCDFEPASTVPSVAFVDGYVYTVAGASIDKSEIKPPPKPDGELCETCDGSGKVGDGKVFTTCMDCNGLGRTGIAGGVSFVDAQAKTQSTAKRRRVRRLFRGR